MSLSITDPIPSFESFGRAGRGEELAVYERGYAQAKKGQPPGRCSQVAGANVEEDGDGKCQS
jgi:hypothetical protein